MNKEIRKNEGPIKNTDVLIVFKRMTNDKIPGPDG